ncbi:HAD-like protein [Lentithecium fluviatile CBS 122367]|uniref:HAD-like protein n=1 Tax=Lentithecium fluviatile CBS 122367 TaxID=1168545 RepID=A0A6G1J865_9PLEO|nr:HAD-like protein [Lentithecium fluviatile CBS 122367]
MAPPKAILFDIGGVCVISPFQAILDYEITNHIPIGYINYAIQKGPYDTGAWQLIERGETELNDAWFSSFKAQLSKQDVWKEYWTKQSVKNSAGGVPGAAVQQPPRVPEIDAKKLFWSMMRISRAPDPWMYPALKKLRESGRFVLGALSNTVHFPTGIADDEGTVFDKSLVHEPHPNPHANDSTDIRDCFDVFLSSAHIGLRKPEPKAYELAVRELGRIAEERGMGKVDAKDVLFLDDIGINLKFARQSGLRTIKVDLGRTKDAVNELEAEAGIPLLDERSKL